MWLSLSCHANSFICNMEHAAYLIVVGDRKSWYWHIFFHVARQSMKYRLMPKVLCSAVPKVWMSQKWVRPRESWICYWVESREWHAGFASRLPTNPLQSLFLESTAPCWLEQLSLSLPLMLWSEMYLKTSKPFVNKIGQTLEQNYLVCILAEWSRKIDHVWMTSCGPASKPPSTHLKTNANW